ncbi:hypothetical protein B0H14DRAFT_2555977 [Mycena olivaceomarginata]|nr:hypothetical protein B0H14DRAFT_2555977 [Mycena olivaceomarginata]
MHASRPSRVSTCTSDDTTSTSIEVNTAAGCGVDEFEPEIRPAWPRSDDSGCSRVSGGDKIAARVMPPLLPRKLLTRKSDDGLGSAPAEQDVDAGSSPEKRTTPVDAGLGYGGSGMGEYPERPGPERAARLNAESTRDRGKITADDRMEVGRVQRVGGEGALPLETTRSLDEEEESQELDFEAALFVWPDEDTAPLLWMDEEIDWFIDAEESLEAPFEPHDPPGL